MALEELRNELKKNMDDVTAEKILHLLLNPKDIEFKTNIPKEDLLNIVTLQSMCNNKRYVKDCGLQMAMGFTGSLVNFYLKDKTSEDGWRSEQLAKILARFMQDKSKDSLSKTWMGESENR